MHDGSCLRKILVHGARSAILRVKRERAQFGAWLDALELSNTGLSNLS
jgi:hypothetical protein